MGRSQVKFRATHGGRGRGGGRGGGRGDGGEHAHRRSSGGGRRPLESNAFRYAEERGDQEGEEGEGEDVTTAQPFRRQFFAGEDEVRGPSARPSSAYFQSQTMKQWDEDDEQENDPSAKSGGGVLDFGWLGEQLAQVAPSIRYQMDPKYCVDFEFEPQEPSDSEEEGEENAAASSAEDEEEKTRVVSAEASTTTAAPVSLARVTATSSASSADSELDMLLQLSSSASSAAARLPSTATTAPSSAVGAGVQQAASDAPEQLEDWLDDVLDM